MKDTTNTRALYRSGNDTSNRGAGLSGDSTVKGPITKPSPPRATKGGKVQKQLSTRAAREGANPYSKDFAASLEPIRVSPDRIPEAPSLLLKQTLIANRQRTIYSPNAHLSENEWAPSAWPSPVLGQGYARAAKPPSSDAKTASTRQAREAAVAAYDDARRAGYFECKVGDDLMATLKALLDLRETYETLVKTEKEQHAEARVAATPAGFIGSDGRITDPLVENAEFCVHVATSGLATIDAAIGRVVLAANKEYDERIFSQAINDRLINSEWWMEAKDISNTRASRGTSEDSGTEPTLKCPLPHSPARRPSGTEKQPSPIAQTLYASGAVHGDGHPTAASAQPRLASSQPAGPVM
ncbi:hypothetical protein AURDEDRAFT_155396 [Auricularia subglabra TFB-10046 SS5]|nr:hypothetical protein AURDEDRAFT_155396 [Auricularia subglabra TFB-10046 SS5]